MNLIKLTKTDGKTFYLNPEFVERVEQDGNNDERTRIYMHGYNPYDSNKDFYLVKGRAEAIAAWLRACG